MLRIPQVSFVISTHNRCDVLLSTLARVYQCGLDASQFDIHVIDNASADQTAQRVRNAFANVKVTRVDVNQGSVAKNIALPDALGQYVVFLDDDSYPTPGSIERMIRHFEADEKLGAATFTITLPDGSRECSAYPDVFIGCGVGFRRRALRLVGGLPDDFFMQAEEYDLSLRLINAGWRVRTFDDLHVMHLKTPRARIASRTMRLDVRNNLYLILRRFPRQWILPYAWDWMKRYAWIASSKSSIGPFVQGLVEGVLRSLVRPKRAAISDDAFEQFAKINETQCRLNAYIKNSSGASRVVLIDCGKNIHAYWRACKALGIEVIAVADAKLAHTGRRYRSIPVVSDEAARAMNYDVAIVANLSPVHASARKNHWRLTSSRPVVDLFADDFAFSAARPAESESRRTVAHSA